MDKSANTTLLFLVMVVLFVLSASLVERLLVRVPPKSKQQPLEIGEAIRSLAEGMLVQAKNPSVLNYKPHAKQYAFHSSDARMRLYIGGNRSGKTVGGVVEDCLWLMGKHPWRRTPLLPVRGRVVGVDFINGIDKNIIPQISQWLPTSELKGGSWDSAYNKELRTLTLENGSFIEFMCVDAQTEVLTRRGWMHREELVHGDDMLTFNLETNMTEWKHISTIYTDENYRGKMARFDSLSEQGIKMTIDALVTPNHKWYTHRGIKQTDELFITDKIRLVAECSDDPDPIYTDAYVSLCGWIGGDGTVWDNRARIYQSHVNRDKQKIIEEIIQDGGWEYQTWVNGTYKLFTVYGEFQKTLDVTLLTAYQRELYLEALLLSDGTIEPSGKWQFTNTDLGLIDLVMMLGTLCGYRVSMSERSVSEWGSKPVYVVMGRSKKSNGRSPNVLKVENAKITYEDYEGVVWCPGSPNQTFIARRGGTVYITGNSYDQDLDKFSGTSRHFVHFDEEPPKDIFTECFLRTVDVGGSMWITMTPVEGMTWIYDDIYEPGLIHQRESTEVITVDMTENPYLSQGEIQALVNSLDAEDREARVHGKFVRLGGLIYKDFSVDTHVIPRGSLDIPKDGIIIASLDAGYNNPTAWLWHYVDPDGNPTTFKEHYASGMVVEEHAQRVHEINKEIGRAPDYYVGDPSIQNTSANGTSIQQDYIKYGIPILLGNNAVRDGINRVAGYLRVRPDVGPRWHVTANCTALISEMLKYRWKTYANRRLINQNNLQEEPHKKNDHACDSLRYFIMSQPDIASGYIGRTTKTSSPNDWVGAPSAIDPLMPQLHEPRSPSDFNSEYNSTGTFTVDSDGSDDFGSEW